MQLRKHQREFKEVIDGIVAGSPVRKIIISATPGSGKSLIPVLAGQLIASGKADKLCWICPRMSLQNQGEHNFIDRRFRDLLGHRLTIRASTNDVNPARGTDGFITTFQALGVDRDQTVLNEFRRRRYVLIVDENHHAEAEDGAWMKAIAPLYSAAAYVVFMSGTMLRGDKKKIAFMPYLDSGDGVFVPCFSETEDTAFIEYSRTDALADRSIIPLSFILHDGQARWEKDGQEKAAKISTTTPMARDALFTALHTGFAQELLETAIGHWQGYKKDRLSSRLLVVAANIKVTKEYTEFLQGKGLSAVIATSEDDKEAAKAIKAFKAGKIDVLVTCQVAYEGLDCPAISHIACLTNIRSEPWIIQMCGRAVRIDPAAGPYEAQRGFIFAPADRMFLELARKIETDQTSAFALLSSSREKSAGEGDGLGGGPSITPLESRMIGQSGIEDLPLFGGFSDKIRQNMPENVQNLTTASEAEAELLGAIDSHVRKYAFQNRYNPKRLNGELYEHFGKPRREMTIKELRDCMAYCQQVWPLTHIRGTGNMRVPIKAHRYAAAWR